MLFVRVGTAWHREKCVASHRASGEVIYGAKCNRLLKKSEYQSHQTSLKLLSILVIALLGLSSVGCEPDRYYKAGVVALAAVKADRKNQKAWAALARSYGKTDAGYSLMLWIDFAEFNNDRSITAQTIEDIPGLTEKERKALRELYEFSVMEQETQDAAEKAKAR